MLDTRYNQRFINQYIRVPSHIMNWVEVKYPTEHIGVRHCLGLIMTNILTYGTVAYSRRKQFYTENRTRYYTRAKILRAVDILTQVGYVVSNTGFKSKSYGRGVSSTLNPLPKLTHQFNHLDRVQLDIKSLPLVIIDSKPIFDYPLIPKESNKDIRSSTSPLPSTYGTAIQLNREYFNMMKIDYRGLDLQEEYLSNVGLTRIFKDGGMGRWFQKGGNSYQELPKDDRGKLLLNGEAVVELDYPAMHPHLIYAWEGEQCLGDFYGKIAELCGCSKFVAKSVCLFALNSASYSKLSSAINLDKARETNANLRRAIPKPILYVEMNKIGLKPIHIVSSIVQVHPVMTKYLFSNISNKLMLEESEVITSVLLKLMELSIPALPVHDSIIAPRRYRDRVRAIMESEFYQQTGFNITVS